MQGSPQFWELRFLEDFYPPSQRPGYGLNLSWSRRGPSQQTTLPLRPEKKSGGQAGRLGHILLPGRGWGEWWFAWWTMPTSSLLSFTFLLHLSQSLHTHSWSVPVTSSVSGLVVCRNYTFLSKKKDVHPNDITQMPVLSHINHKRGGTSCGLHSYL